MLIFYCSDCFCGLSKLSRVNLCGIFARQIGTEAGFSHYGRMMLVSKVVRLSGPK
jgi:hypothetical protein